MPSHSNRDNSSITRPSPPPKPTNTRDGTSAALLTDTKGTIDIMLTTTYTTPGQVTVSWLLDTTTALVGILRGDHLSTFAMSRAAWDHAYASMDAEAAAAALASDFDEEGQWMGDIIPTYDTPPDGMITRHKICVRYGISRRAAKGLPADAYVTVPTGVMAYYRDTPELRNVAQGMGDARARREAEAEAERAAWRAEREARRSRRGMGEARGKFASIGTRKAKLRLNRAAKTDPVAHAVRLALEIEDASTMAKGYGGQWRRDYYERKHANIVALVTVCREQGWVYGVQSCDDAPDVTHVLYVEIPGCEQVSWHCTADATWPLYRGTWDGQRDSTLRKLEAVTRTLIDCTDA